LTSGRSVNKVLLAEKLNPHVQRKFISMSKEAGTIVQKVPKKKMDQLAGHHQGDIAYVAPYRYRTLDDLLKRVIAIHAAPFCVILSVLARRPNHVSLIQSASVVGPYVYIIHHLISVMLFTMHSKPAAD